jgi:hypothetical protein
MPEDERQTDRRAEDQHDKQLVKEAIKEAISEWLTARFTDFGRWSVYGLAALALAFALTAFVFFVANSPGLKQAIGQAAGASH